MKPGPNNALHLPGGVLASRTAPPAREREFLLSEEPVTKDQVLKQITDQLDAYQAAHARSRYDDLSDLGDSEKALMLTRLAATIDRLAPAGSRYELNAHAALKRYGETSAYNIPLLVGVLQALRADYEAGFLASVEELIHADVFGDFLEMAHYLLDEGYKDPAAVITGGVLEEHLRQLCVRNGIPTVSSGRPKKADSMNTELAVAGAISKLDQKNVTAWLDLRNKSAHGKYTEYSHQQVGLLIQGVQDFITRVPA